MIPLFCGALNRLIISLTFSRSISIFHKFISNSRIKKSLKFLWTEQSRLIDKYFSWRSSNSTYNLVNSSSFSLHKLALLFFLLNEKKLRKSCKWIELPKCNRTRRKNYILFLQMWNVSIPVFRIWIWSARIPNISLDLYHDTDPGC